MDLINIDMFDSDLTKNRGHWLKYFPINIMEYHMAVKEVVRIVTVHESMDNIHYEFFCLK